MAYLGRQPNTGVRSRYIFTATASQTTFSGSDDDGKTLKYEDAAYLDVFLNGVLLKPVTDYTATSKTSVVLTSGASASDIVEIVAYDIASIADTVSKANGGTFDANVTVNGTVTADGLTVDTNTLYVDAANNRVGIGTSSPSANLEITQSGNNVGLLVAGGGYNYTAKFESSDAEANIIIEDSNSTNDGNMIGVATNDMYFITNASEAMRIDSSGNLLVGTTDDSVYNNSGSGTGINLQNFGNIAVARDGNDCMVLNRLNSDGPIALFNKNGTTVGSIGAFSGDLYVINTGGVGAGLRYNSGFPNILPCNGTGADRDNVIDLGSSSVRFNDAYVTNGVTSGSDANEKQQIAVLTDAEIAAAKRISAGFKTFKWNDAVEAKGDNARTHTGVIAQEVQTALEAEGLDAGNYAFFISTTWWETQTEVPAVEAVEAQDAVYEDVIIPAVEEQLDEEGNVVVEAQPERVEQNLVSEAVEAVEAKEAYTRTDTYDTLEEAPEGATERTRLGIRYPELLAFIGAATEQRLTSIEARLATLENA